MIPSRTHCPDCNSLQRFTRRERLNAGEIEVFIACSACGWEAIVASYPASEQRARLRERLETLREYRRHLRVSS